MSKSSNASSTFWHHAVLSLGRSDQLSSSFAFLNIYGVSQLSSSSHMKYKKFIIVNVSFCNWDRQSLLKSNQGLTYWKRRLCAKASLSQALNEGINNIWGFLHSSSLSMVYYSYIMFDHQLPWSSHIAISVVGECGSSYSHCKLVQQKLYQLVILLNKRDFFVSLGTLMP